MAITATIIGAGGGQAYSERLMTTWQIIVEIAERIPTGRAE